MWGGGGESRMWFLIYMFDIQLSESFSQCHASPVRSTCTDCRLSSFESELSYTSTNLF